MKRKQPYKAPAVLREVRLQLEQEILDASVVDVTAPIVSSGQELENLNAGSGNEGFEWNDKWDWN